MATTYIVEPILKINGSAASDALIEDILQICVEESLHLPAMVTIIIKNDPFSARSNDQIWKHQSLFEIGTEISVGFGSSTMDDAEFATQLKGDIFQGEVTAIENFFTQESQAPIIIRGYDVAHRLHRGRFNRSFQNVKDSDVVSKVIGEVGISAGTVEATSTTHEYLFQENQTNMEFLRERAARNGYELFVQDGKLNFRKPKSGGSVALTWLEELQSFKVRVSSGEQVNKVEVRGWDYEQKKAIVGTASSATVLTSNQHGTGSAKSSAFKGKPTTPTVTIVDQPVYLATEATSIAQSLCDELGGEFIQADAIAIGNPTIRPGKVVTLQEMGKYTGSYYVTETRHLFVNRVYTTEFSVRGLRGGDILTALSPQTRLQPGQTLMIGMVTNNNDPKKWGRVKVKFPTLTEEHESHWARVVAIGAGPDRGFDCLPEINDEVLVAFEHGDIAFPYILGSLWNGKDKPPLENDDGENNIRMIKSRSGHKIVLDDTEDKEKIIIEDKSGKNIITIDCEKNSLSVQIEEDINIEAKGKITIKSTDKDIAIECKNLEIKTQQACKIEAGSNCSIEAKSKGEFAAKSGLEITCAAGVKVNNGALEVM